MTPRKLTRGSKAWEGSLARKQRKYKTDFDKGEPDEFDRIMEGMRQRDRAAWKKITGAAFIQLKFGVIEKSVKSYLARKVRQTSSGAASKKSRAP